MKMTLLIVVATLLWLPTSLGAQATASLGPSTCPWRCVCGDDGCGCIKGDPGSGGRSCTTNGGGCYVGACDASALVMFEAGDGSFAIVERDILPEGNGAPARRDWQVDAAGQSVLRTCGDVIIARNVDPGLADRLRQIGREITI